MNANDMEDEFCRVRFLDVGGADIGLFFHANCMILLFIFIIFSAAGRLTQDSFSVWVCYEGSKE